MSKLEPKELNSIRELNNARRDSARKPWGASKKLVDDLLSHIDAVTAERDKLLDRLADSGQECPPGNFPGEFDDCAQHAACFACWGRWAEVTP
jgi:hypothetical protein